MMVKRRWKEISEEEMAIHKLPMKLFKLQMPAQLRCAEAIWKKRGS